MDDMFPVQKEYQMGTLRLSDHKTKTQQLEFLKRVIYTLTVMMSLSVKKIKPGRNRDIVYTHFH